MFSDRVPLTKNSSKTGHYMGKFIADLGWKFRTTYSKCYISIIKTEKNIRYKSNSQVYSQYFDL